PPVPRQGPAWWNRQRSPFPARTSTILAEADLKLRRRTEGRTVEKRGTYRNLLVVNEYEVRKVHRGKLPSNRVLVVKFAVKDGIPSALQNA
ncbi:MAG: hypothetical protein ACLFV7_08125, partial [Phycisphaerae bacterium]